MQHVTLKHEQISEYWRGRGISNEGNEIEDYTSGGVKVYYNDCECWACGKRVETKSDLQRCHIVPKSLGGREEASNYFLLCSDCHDEAPDTTNREAFLRWVYKKKRNYDYGYRNLFKILDDINEELRERGESRTIEEMFFDLTILQQQYVNKCYGDKERVKKYSLENLGIHFSETKGPKAKEKSVTIVAVDMFMKFAKEAKELYPD